MEVEMLRKLTWSFATLAISISLFTWAVRSARNEVKSLVKETVNETIDENMARHRKKIRRDIKNSVKKGVEEGFDEQMARLPEWMRDK